MPSKHYLIIRQASAFFLAMALFGLTIVSAQAKAAGTLEFGSRGPDVLALQKDLLSLGFDPSGVDGKFGRGTENAVIAYQNSNNLKVDGKAGAATLVALKAAIAAQNTAAVPAATDSTNPNTLKYGDQGPRVTDMQTKLSQLGYPTNGIDGRFGTGTQRAVIAFQKANKMKADGLAGAQTLSVLDKLFNQASPAAGGSANVGSTGFTRTLRKGVTGADVKEAQVRLKALGYYTGSVDGVYGTGSMAAVAAFQKRNSLTADGLAGSQTIARLFSPLAQAASGSGGEPAGGGSSNNADSGSGSSAGTGSSTGASITYITLRVGSTGIEVRSLQQALKNLNYNVTVDGSYGNGTRDAVIAFQKRNGLGADGVAGAATQTRLFSSSAQAAGPAESAEPASGGTGSNGSGNGGSGDNSLPAGAGQAEGPPMSSVRLLHWFNEIRPSVHVGQTLIIYDPATKLQWELKLYSLGRHADSEPKTLTDTQIMFKAFGYKNTWTPKPVYVKLPNGAWTLAAMHNVPHLSGTIQNNGFNGHLCVHFFRDMDECRLSDPNYGVQNQEIIRRKWKAMTGETVP